MRVEVLYFDGCPSHAELLPRLRELVREAGEDPDAAIELRAVESLEAAQEHRFLGSPTVRVDGADVEPGAAQRDDFGLKCRLYRSEEGQAPTPPERWIRAALAATAGDRVWEQLTARHGPCSPPSPDRPAVCLNMVSSVDGATTVDGRVGRLTGAVDQALLHRLRYDADAVLVGAGTVRAEGYGALLAPELRERREQERGAAEPLLCVVTRRPALAADAPVLGPSPCPLVFLTGSSDALPRAARPLMAFRQPPGERPAEALVLGPLLRRLREELGVTRIVCEGGPTLNAALLAEELVDELFVSISPLLAQEQASPPLVARNAPPVDLELLGRADRGGFVFLRYRTRHAAAH